MPRINELDRHVLEALTGADKLKAILKARDLSITEFARKYNHWVSDVSRCIGGKQPLDAIRDDLAKELGLEREQVDALIEERSV